MEHKPSTAQSPAPNRQQRFVQSLLQRCQQDKGLAAALRRADNPATEYQSWEFLAAHHIDLEQNSQRLPYTTIAAALARSKITHNGSLPLGQALARSYPSEKNDQKNSPAKARLRRLLACNQLDELCPVLRPLLTLIDSRLPGQLDYARLLTELCYFERHPEQSKARWAQSFYQTTNKSVTEQESADALDYQPATA
ncbi:type I-E CRISPR-associated protein Cse2/CasB [Neisseriaceae bacterium TC5R-5]|nr:type I-E CRISPR-associated protein Cse2/CasB [Neisseriaceae bacterium TC5R-5]